MKNLLKAEFYYLYKNIRYYVFVALIILGNLSSIIFKQNVISLIANFAVFVFAAILLLEFSHKDFKYKTMKNYIGSGQSLIKVYFAKLIVCLVAIFILMFFQRCLGTTSDIVCNSKEISDINYIAIALSMFINLLRCTVIFCICSLISSGSLSIVVSLIYVLIIPIVKSFIKNDVLQAIDPFMLDSIENSINGQAMNGLEITQDLPVIFDANFFLHLGVAICVVAVINIIGCYVFSRREVK